MKITKSWKRMSGVPFLWSAIVLGGIAFAPSVQAAPCGTVKARSGESCEFLDVLVDLTGCEVSSGKGSGTVTCESDGTAKVSFAGAEGTYRASLKKSASGWVVTEPLAKSSGKAPKKLTEREEANQEVSKPKKSKKAKKSDAVPVAKSAEVPIERVFPEAKAVETQPAPVTTPTPAPTPSVAAVPATVPLVAVMSKSPLTIAGSARFRAEAKDNLDFLESATDSSRFGLMRFRLDFLFKPRSDVSLFVQPQASRTWGKNEVVSSSVTGTTPVASSTSTSGGTQDSRMDLHQGYLSYRPGEPSEIIVGRQILAYGDEMLIGALDWHNVSRSFDAMKTSFTFAPGKIDLFWSKITERNDTSAGAGDKDFYGLYSSWNLGEGFKQTDLYALHSNEASTAPKQKTSAVGLRLKSPLGAFDYRLEVTGENVRGASEYQGDLELGYTVWAAKKLRFSAEYFRASKDFDQFFPTFHKWLGIADYFGRRNIQGYRVGASMDFSSIFSVVADYHCFSRTDTSGPAYSLTGTTGYGTAGDAKAIAHEFDLIAKLKLNELLTLSGGGGWVVPAAYMKANRGPDSGYFSYAELMLLF
jgi:hypothetical protein